jgi:hypothetical protein
MTANDKYLNKNDVRRADMLNGLTFGSGPRSAGTVFDAVDPELVALSGVFVMVWTGH